MYMSLPQNCKKTYIYMCMYNVKTDRGVDIKKFGIFMFGIISVRG